jgi:hypothetical protein
MLKFTEFLESIITENLHPELKSIIKSAPAKSRKSLLLKRIKELSDRGEKTGIEGNMPQGSSRAYLKHEEPHEATVDGKPGKFQVGTKFGINGSLEKHHDKSKHDGESLGQMQNRIENGDHYINSQYRILEKKDDGKYVSNKESGIFPPIVDHDHENHDWSTVGHSKDIKAGEFRKLTKTKEHPQGISHHEFTEALIRQHHKDKSKYWAGSPPHEEHMNHITKHPLVERFLDHQRNYDSNPLDYRQRKNLGVFEHPDGSKHIVARDHGFNDEVSKAYWDAREKRK